MNTFQRQTNTGKPVTNRLGLPLFKLPINLRLKHIKTALGLNKEESNEVKWDNIKYEVNRLFKT